MLLLVSGTIISSLGDIINSSDTLPIWVSINNSLLKMLRGILGLACVIHVITLLLVSLKGEHSFLWLIIQQYRPLAVSILVAFMITVIQQGDDTVFESLLIGIASGVISSIIVLIMDRKNTLVDNVLKHSIPEYLESHK